MVLRKALFMVAFTVTTLTAMDVFANDVTAREIQTYCSIPRQIQHWLLPSQYFYYWKEAKAGRIDVKKVSYSGLVRVKSGQSLQTYDRQHVRVGSTIGTIASVQTTFCGLAMVAADPAIAQIEDGSGSALRVLP